MIFTCTSKGNTLANGLSFGLTNPLYFMLITPSMEVNPAPRSTLLIWFLGPIAYSRQDFFHGRKKCTHGGTPYSFLLSTSSPRDPSPPISSLGWLSKTRCAPTLSLFPHCPANSVWRKRWKSLCWWPCPSLSCWTCSKLCNISPSERRVWALYCRDAVL